MKKTKYICDKCKKVVESECGYEPNDWATISYDASVQYHKKSYVYHFCPDCAAKLNIEKPITQERQESIGERLIQLIEEVVVNAEI